VGQGAVVEPPTVPSQNSASFGAFEGEPALGQDAYRGEVLGEGLRHHATDPGLVQGGHEQRDGGAGDAAIPVVGADRVAEEEVVCVWLGTKRLRAIAPAADVTDGPPVHHDRAEERVRFRETVGDQRAGLSEGVDSAGDERLALRTTLVVEEGGCVRLVRGAQAHPAIGQGPRQLHTEWTVAHHRGCFAPRAEAESSAGGLGDRGVIPEDGVGCSRPRVACEIPGRTGLPPPVNSFPG